MRGIRVLRWRQVRVKDSEISFSGTNVMNPYSKIATYICSAIGIVLLLVSAIYVNINLSNHLLAEADVVSEARALSKRFVVPMRRLQNKDLIESLESFRGGDSLSKLQAPEVMSLISAAPSLNKSLSSIDETLDQLKKFRPIAAKVSFGSLRSQIEAAHANHKNIVLYANLGIVLGFLLIIGLLLHRISALIENLRVANAYLDLNGRASYFSENQELEDEIEDYSYDDDELTVSANDDTVELKQAPVVQNHSKQIVSVQNDSKTVKPVVELQSLEQQLQKALNEEVERTGHLATLHGATLDEEVLSTDSVVIMKPILESLVRNAVVHGGRSPRVREKSLKSKILNVFIDFEESDTEYTLTVADDGEGVEGEAARDHALANKLITPEIAKDLTTESAARLIFLPGYSRDRSKPESGSNNLKLDSVRELIKQHNGTIGMHNKVGDLCKFIIRIPKEAQEVAA